MDRDGRLTVRFDRDSQRWIKRFGGDESQAVRALLALGAALMDLPGARDAAIERAGARLNRETLLWLLEASDKQQTNGRQTADKRQTAPPTIPDPEQGPVPTLADLDDPLADVGIDV